MSGGESKAERKQAFFAKLIKLFEEYPKIFLVTADNVGSNHMQKIRIAMRGRAIMLMGKNTMIRKAIRGHAQNNPQLEALLPHIRGNIGFIFTKEELGELKKEISANVVAAPAKAGTIAPSDVTIPAGNTGMEPTQTAFFQALNIPTKINRGQIEIVSDVPLIKVGDKVGASEANLLSRLNINPFSYGLKFKVVYEEGSIYEANILDLTDEDLTNKFRQGVRNIACLGLAVGYPTVASVPHSLIRGYKNILAVSLATDYEIEAVARLQASAAAAPAAATGGAPAAVEAAPVEEEEKEEEDEDMGFGLFD